jgi:hypothetical protein
LVFVALVFQKKIIFATMKKLLSSLLLIACLEVSDFWGLPKLSAQNVLSTDSVAVLQQRVDELENKVNMLLRLQRQQMAATLPSATVASPPATLPLTQPQGASNWQLTRTKNTGVITRQQMEEFGYGGFVVSDGLSTKISIGGLIVASAYQDFHEMNEENAFVVSAIPVNPKIWPRTRFDVSNSRFYINADVRGKENEYKTRFEFDLNGSGGSYAFHLRNAYVTFWRIRVGYAISQFEDIPVSPDVSDNGGPPGTVGLRQTGISYEQPIGTKWNVIFSLEDGEGNILEEGSDILSKTSRISPDFVVSVRWKPNETSLTQASISGVMHPIGYENINFSRKIAIGGAVNAAVRYGFTQKDYLTALLFFSSGASKYLNDPINGYDAFIDLKEDRTTGAITGADLILQKMYGGYFYYHHDWIQSKLSSNIGYSFIGGYKSSFSRPEFYTQELYGHYSSLNLYYYPTEKISFGIEAIGGVRVNADHTRGFNIRLMAQALFSF